MSARIRLRYSTVINYASMLYRMAVAVGFVVIVARRLSVEEFGLWGIIFSVSGMLASLVALWSFWAQRFYARGWWEAPGTGLALTLIYWAPGTLMYLAVSLLEERILGWGFGYMLAGLPLFLLQTLNTYLLGVSNVSVPELRGYRGFLYDTLRLVFAYTLVARLNLGLAGALLAVELALLAGALYLGLKLLRAKVLRPAFSRRLAAEWFRGLFIPLIGMVNQFMRAGLRAVVSWVSGSEVPVAYLNVGFASEAPLLQASQATVPALYARVLRERRGVDVEESLRLFLLFAGYMLATFTLLSRTIASLYNPRYAEAHTVIPLIAVYATMLGLAAIYGTTIGGAETIDEQGVPPPRRLLGSQLFRIPAARLISMLLSYALAVPALIYYRGDPLRSAEAVAAALALGATPLLAYYYREAGRMLPHRPPLRELAAVLAGSIATGAYYAVMGVHELRVTRFWAYAPSLALHLAAGLAVYGATVYALSPWARRLLRDAATYMRGVLG